MGSLGTKGFLRAETALSGRGRRGKGHPGSGLLTLRGQLAGGALLVSCLLLFPVFPCSSPQTFRLGVRVCPGPSLLPPTFLINQQRRICSRSVGFRKCCTVGPEPPAAAQDSDLQTVRLQPEVDGQQGGCSLKTRICAHGGAGLGGVSGCLGRCLSSFQNQPQRGCLFTCVLFVCVCWCKSVMGQGAFPDLPQK